MTNYQEQVLNLDAEHDQLPKSASSGEKPYEENLVEAVIPPEY